MRWFSNVRTGTKLSLSFGVIVFILIAVTAMSYSTINFMNKTSNTLYNEDFVLLSKLMRVHTDEAAIRAALLSMLLAEGRPERDSWNQKIKAISDDLDKNYADISNLQQDNNKFLTKFEGLVNLREDNRKTRQNEVIPLILDGKLDEAKKIGTSIQNDRYEKMYAMIEDLVESVRERANASLMQSNKEVTKTTVIFLWIGTFSVLVSIGLIILLNRLIAKPINEISAAAQKIALGDITSINFQSKGRKDEIGILTDAFSSLSHWLQGVSNIAEQIATGDLTPVVQLQSSKDTLGSSFQTMIKNLQQLTREMMDVINLLSISSNEISTAITQLASTASETATSVGETTTTIEEVRQTSEIASKKAKSVSEASLKSSEASQSGKKAVDEINEMTNKIHNQMELISESMVRLSEQSQAIGTIISSVDDLAQQSKLLAVNASIEAAKAGEQGKGFAIVAQEVKSLSSQSKEATNHIRAILNDIQKATSSAVMATEQGTKAVEDSVKTSAKTGESIVTLIETVAEASHAATQIAASSHQQLIGMDQAAVAMENIKQASIQNMEGTKQLEQSATSIKELGNKLQTLVSRYKLKNEV